MVIKKQIFEELNFQEFKDKYLFRWESDKLEVDFVMILRRFIRYIPLGVFSALFIHTFLELYKAKRDIYLMET